MYKRSLINLLVVIAIVFMILPLSACDDSYMPSDADKAAVKGLPSDFLILGEAWKILQSDYVDKSKLDPVKMAQGAVRGMVAAIGDPYTSYISPESHKLEMSGLLGEYQGIGAYITRENNYIGITGIIPGSPAEAAGLLAGDLIIKINGESTELTSTSEAALKIQGEAGTPVMLNIYREGDDEPFDIEIIRGEVKIASITSEMKGDIAYIKVQQFTNSTTEDFKKILSDSMDKGANGLILDLRNNPGGLLNQAVDMASQFLVRGIVVKVVDGEGVEVPYKVKSGGIATNLPMIVLVDGNSASASEILAGALQDSGRAKLAGYQTYGKGSVQVIREMDDGSSIHVTVAKFYTPLSNPINGVGLTPDYELELEGDALVEWAEDYLNDLISPDNGSAMNLLLSVG